MLLYVSSLLWLWSMSQRHTTVLTSHSIARFSFSYSMVSLLILKGLSFLRMWFCQFQFFSWSHLYIFHHHSQFDPDSWSFLFVLLLLRQYRSGWRKVSQMRYESKEEWDKDVCCYLFNLYTETIFRHIEESKGVTIRGTQINNLRYADDTVLLADSEENLPFNHRSWNK